MADDLEARTLGEMVRQFERFQLEMKEDMRDLRRAAESAVRRDVYTAEQRLLEARMLAIETAREKDKQRSDRAIQLAVGSLILPVVVAFIAAVFAYVLGRS